MCSIDAQIWHTSSVSINVTFNKRCRLGNTCASGCSTSGVRFSQCIVSVSLTATPEVPPLEPHFWSPPRAAMRCSVPEHASMRARRESDVDHRTVRINLLLFITVVEHPLSSGPSTVHVSATRPEGGERRLNRRRLNSCQSPSLLPTCFNVHRVAPRLRKRGGVRRASTAPVHVATRWREAYRCSSRAVILLSPSRTT
jgi:hypothetical protein